MQELLLFSQQVVFDSLRPHRLQHSRSAVFKSLGSIPGLGRSPGEGNGNPLQYSHLGNPMDRGGWWATVHGVVRVEHDLMTKPLQLPPSGPVALQKMFAELETQAKIFLGVANDNSVIFLQIQQ